MNKILTLIIFVVTGLAIYWFVSRHIEHNRFPVLSSGFYQGSIVGLNVKNPDQAKQIYLRSITTENNQLKIFVTILDSNWLDHSFEHPLTQQTKNLSALTLQSTAGNLILWGQPNKGSAEFIGGFSDKISGATGTWRIKKIEAQSDGDSIEPAQLQHMVLLRAELDKVEQDLSFRTKKLESSQKEATELAAFVTNPDSLKKSADLRFQEAEEKVNDATNKAADLTANVIKLQDQVKLAYKVTQRGTLVSLARESLERESRWVESMFRSKVGEERVDLSKDLERARYIADLRKQITEERNLLFELRITEEYAR